MKTATRQRILSTAPPWLAAMLRRCQDWSPRGTEDLQQVLRGCIPRLQDDPDALRCVRALPVVPHQLEVLLSCDFLDPAALEPTDGSVLFALANQQAQTHDPSFPLLSSTALVTRRRGLRATVGERRYWTVTSWSGWDGPGDQIALAQETATAHGLGVALSVHGDWYAGVPLYHRTPPRRPLQATEPRTLDWPRKG